MISNNCEGLLIAVALIRSSVDYEYVDSEFAKFAWRLVADWLFEDDLEEIVRELLLEHRLVSECGVVKAHLHGKEM